VENSGSGLTSIIEGGFMKFDKSELSGTCLECGKHYSGWILKEPRCQICVKCGGTLQVKKNDIVINTPNACFQTLVYKFVVKKKDDCNKQWN
jgi:hypothetical protein